MTEANEELRATGIIEEIKQAEIRFVVALPDRTTSHHLLKGLSPDPALRLVKVCKEDEGISICSGIYCCGHRALLLIQYTGLLGKEPGVPPTKSGRYGLRIVEPVLDAMEIEHHMIETPEDTSKIVPAVKRAYDLAMPVVMLIGREPH